MRIAIVALTVVTLTARAAAAADDDDAPSPFDARSTAVFLHTALHGPYGVAGFEAEQAVLPLWTLSAGVGLGDASLQGGAMTHLRFGAGRSRLEVGAGLSYGKEVWQDLCGGDDICAQKAGTVVRANVEVGGAHRWPGGFTMKYFVGYGRVVEGSLTCEGVNANDCDTKLKNEGLATAYTGFAIGASF
jgi:hypothetical protein